MARPVRSICIAGGGTAGWLAAGIIAARHAGEPGRGLAHGLEVLWIDNRDPASIPQGLQRN